MKSADIWSCGQDFETALEHPHFLTIISNPLHDFATPAGIHKIEYDRPSLLDRTAPSLCDFYRYSLSTT